MYFRRAPNSNCFITAIFLFSSILLPVKYSFDDLSECKTCTKTFSNLLCIMTVVSAPNHNHNGFSNKYGVYLIFSGLYLTGRK